METAIYVIMLLVCFGFVLKQTFQKLLPLLIVGGVCALYIGCSWPIAIEQSRTQIAEWLANPKLMRDTSVLLCIDIAMYLWYCFLSVNLSTEGQRPRRVIWLYRILRFYPGVSIFIVLLSFLISLIFAFPGVAFTTVAWGFAVVFFVALPLLSWGVKWLLPEKEIRLEILFWIEIVTLLTGIVVTVNGTTAVVGTDEIEWLPTAGICLITLAGATIGFLRNKFKNNKNKQI